MKGSSSDVDKDWAFSYSWGIPLAMLIALLLCGALAFFILHRHSNARSSELAPSQGYVTVSVGQAPAQGYGSVEAGPAGGMNYQQPDG